MPTARRIHLNIVDSGQIQSEMPENVGSSVSDGDVAS